jgi:anti-anti-sigma factor
MDHGSLRNYSAVIAQEPGIMQIKKPDDIFIVAPDLPIDAAAAMDLDERVLMAMDDGSRHIILNLENCSYSSACGLQAMHGIASRLQGIGGHLVIAGAGDQAHALMHMSGLSHLLLQFDTVADAERHLRELQDAPEIYEDELDDE